MSWDRTEVSGMTSTRSKFEGVVFDLGETLYRPAHDFCVEFLTRLGIRQHIGLPYDQLVRLLEDSAGRWLDQYMIDNGVGQYWKPSHQIWVEYSKRFLIALGVNEDIDELAVKYEELWERTLSSRRPTLIEGCRETLEELRNAGIRLGVASNRFDDPRPMLQQDGILHFFDAVEYSNVPRYRKPNPFMLQRVAHRLRLPPEKCVYVGNKVDDDVVAAQRTQMQPVLITWCHSGQIQTPLPEGVIVIDHISQVLDIVL